MKVGFTPLVTKFANTGLGAIGKGVLNGIGAVAYLGAAYVVGRDIGTAIYNRISHDNKPSVIGEYVIDPIADKIEQVRETSDAVQELKARGINVKRRDAVATLHTIEYNEALEAYNSNPEKYVCSALDLGLDLENLPDNLKVLLYNMYGTSAGLQEEFINIFNKLNEMSCSQGELYQQMKSAINPSEEISD